MTYALGVDLGTTYTAAAIKRGDRLTMAELGNRSSTIPSVVFMREDGTILTADSAIRRGATEPGRLAREFKRRMGDTTPIILGGTPFSVDALMARLLADVVASVTEREGEAPDAIAVAYPANWGQYKKDLLAQAVQRADLDGVSMITEPEAAATHYASLERLDPGATIAVYDLGGGTFDAAVLRKTADGFEFLGAPEGIERLGGIDFDEAVYRHVVESIRGAMDDLDVDDPVAQAAVARLRAECVAAKEALSSDTDVSIPVLLPNVQTEVRLTRAEFEGMIRPALADTIVVIERAVRSAGITAEDLDAVLLVGGSSRVPLVGQIVAAEIGRPVAIDVHPKHSVALGAALVAAGDDRAVAPLTPSKPDVDRDNAPVVADTAAAVPVIVPATRDEPALTEGLIESPHQPTVSAAATSAAAPDAGNPPTAVMPPTPAAPTPRPTAPSADFGSGNQKPSRAALIGVGVVAALAIGGGLAFAFGGGDDPDTSPDVVSTNDTEVPVTAAPDTTPTTDSVPDTVAATSTTEAAPDTTTTTTLPPPPCDGVGGPCVEITSLTDDGSAVIIDWLAFNFEPDTGRIHPHFFWSNATADQAGTNAPPGQQVGWEITDDLRYTTTDELMLVNRPLDASGICATPGNARLDPPHSVIDPEVVHCIDLP